MKVITVLGARPQFIKASTVSKELAKHSDVEEVMVHTGQHFDKNMSNIFFNQMGIKEPKYNLEINSLNHGAMTGRMLEEMTIEMIKSGNYRSMPRNLQIASVFKEAGLIEKYGSGIKRVIRAFLNYELQEPLFEEIQGGLNVTVYKKVTGGVNGGVNGGVTGGVKESVNGGEEVEEAKMLAYMDSHPGQNAKQLCVRFGISLRTTERRLKNLKDQNLIEFRGAPKTGGYYFKQKKREN